MEMPNVLRHVLPKRERYQRPHNYNISVGGVVIPISPGRQRTPVLSFLVQNDINNTGVINVGDSHVSLTNGVQLDPGRAWVFGISAAGLLASGLSATPVAWADAMQIYAGQSQGGQYPPHVQLYIDIGDFFAISDTPAQNLRIFWSTTTGA